MSCGKSYKTTAKTASVAGGIPNLSSLAGAEAGQTGEVSYYLPTGGRKEESQFQPLPWPPAGRQRRGFWGDYRQRVKAALQAWRSEADDHALARVRAELASDLADQAACIRINSHPAGVADQLAEERAALLLFPPKSISVAERVEQIAVLDNAIALLRLRRAINDTQYRAAVVDTVCDLNNKVVVSTAPVTWLPERPVGAEMESPSTVDPTCKIRARYRVVDLSEPITSNTLTGEVNPAYDQSLQPRQRNRAASRLQIEDIAKKLDSNTLLKTESNWSDGPPLLSADGMVESGNGRLLGLRLAAQINPQGYEAYRQQLILQANKFGLDPVEIAELRQPVLVRERLTEMTSTARVRFVNEANASGAARMGASEQARADAKLIPPGFFADLHFSESADGLADALIKKINAPVVARFFNLLPETERPTLMNSRGELSIEGVRRLERAIFAYAIAGESGERLARLVFDEGEAIDRVGAGLRQSLLKLGQLEDLIKAGQRNQNLSLGDDLAVVVEKMRDIRQQGLSRNDYLRQYKMFPELNPFQEQLLIQLDERRRSAKAVSGLLNAYANEAIMNTQPPNQASMFGQEFASSREDLLRSALKKIGGVWVADLSKWSTAQRVMSGLDLPASQIQKLTPSQRVKGMKMANRVPVPA